MSQTKDIKICPRCQQHHDTQEPLISTFMFMGAEYYCLWCGWTGGIFDGERVKRTKELAYKDKLYKAIFRLLQKDIWFPGAYKADCPKCASPRTAENYHCNHADKDKHRIAHETLNRLTGTDTGEK